MFKPHNLSIKDYLVKKLAVSMNIPEKTIDAVISHQFNSLNNAVRENVSIEMTGFGKFIYAPIKARKVLAKENMKADYFKSKLNLPENTEAYNISLTNKLNNTLKDIDILTKKLKMYEQIYGVSSTYSKRDTSYTRDSISVEERSISEV